MKLAEKGQFSPPPHAAEARAGRLADAHVATGLALRKALVAAKLAAPVRWSSKFVVHDITRLVARIDAYQR